MPTETMPLLRRSAKVSKNNGSVAIQYLTDEIVLDGAAATLFSKMLPHLDGKTRLDRLAEQIAEPTQRVQALSKKLAATGVLTFADPSEKTMTGPEFYELHPGSIARTGSSRCTSTHSGRRSRTAPRRARRFSASPSRSTTTSKAPTSTWRSAPRTHRPK